MNDPEKESMGAASKYAVPNDSDNVISTKDSPTEDRADGDATIGFTEVVPTKSVTGDLTACDKFRCAFSACFLATSSEN